MAVIIEEKERVMEAFRRGGYLQADLDPLGYLKPQPHPELEQNGEAAEQARRYYCGSIGVEFMPIDCGRRATLLFLESRTAGRPKSARRGERSAFTSTCHRIE